jgi:hypothetical protein
MRPIPPARHAPRQRARPRPGLAALGAAVLLAGCAALPTAQMETPSELTSAQPQSLPLAAGRSGHLELPAALGGGALRFERSADRWSFFSTADIDRASLTLNWQPMGQPAAEHRCRLRRTGVQMGGVEIDAQPARLVCEGPGTQLSLQARPGALRTGRNGQFVQGAWTLDIRSVHRIQGSPLPSDEPVGYLMLDQGRPVAALDLLDSRPHLRVQTPDPGQRQAAVTAALLLALVWQPGT